MSCGGGAGADWPAAAADKRSTISSNDGRSSWHCFRQSFTSVASSGELSLSDCGMSGCHPLRWLEYNVVPVVDIRVKNASPTYFFSPEYTSSAVSPQLYTSALVLYAIPKATSGAQNAGVPTCMADTTRHSVIPRSLVGVAKRETCDCHNRCRAAVVFNVREFAGFACQLCDFSVMLRQTNKSRL